MDSALKSGSMSTSPFSVMILPALPWNESKDVQTLDVATGLATTGTGLQKIVQFVWFGWSPHSTYTIQRSQSLVFLEA